MRPPFLIPLVAATLLAACSRHESTGASAVATRPPVKVQVATVHYEKVPELTEVTGVVRPVRRAQIAAKVMGVITELPVTLGQKVRAGDVLLTISAGEISARLVQAQSQLNAARRDLERERELLPRGASTPDMVRGLEDRFAAAQAQVREAETMLGYATLRAPFDGAVARKLVNVGDLASPGMPLLEVEDTQTFEVDAALPESIAASLEIGAPLTVAVTGEAPFVGRIAELSPAADPGALTILAKVAVPEGARVHSGQFARVQVTGGAVPALLIPASAVSRSGQMERVFVVTPGNRTELRLVKLGAARAQRVEIVAGLDDRERVIVAPPPGLAEGQPILAE